MIKVKYTVEQQLNPGNSRASFLSNIYDRSGARDSLVAIDPHTYREMILIERFSCYVLETF